MNEGRTRRTRTPRCAAAGAASSSSPLRRLAVAVVLLAAAETPRYRDRRRWGATPPALAVAVAAAAASDPAPGDDDDPWGGFESAAQEGGSPPRNDDSDGVGVGVGVGGAEPSPPPPTPPPPPPTPSPSSSSFQSPGRTPTVPSPPPAEDAAAEEERGRRMDDFAEFCRQVLGIRTSLVVREFDYVDYMSEEREGGWYGGGGRACDGDDDYLPTEEGPPTPTEARTVKVRGLAASRPIEVGDVVISIPLNALISPRTSIDHDPVLGRVLGPEARRSRGWDGPNAPDYEIPLLIIWVLYHRSLGSRSPMREYVDVLLTAPSDGMPSLWDSARLRRDAGEGVRAAAREIRGDVRDMYDAVMAELIRDHPDVFGPPPEGPGGGGGGGGLGGGAGWAYSLEMFRWAFAMVNSRHWHVPVRDLDESPPPAVGAGASTARKPMSEAARLDEPQRPTKSLLSSVAYEPPPAEQPTDEYVQRQEGILSTGVNSPLEEAERAGGVGEVLAASAAAAPEGGEEEDDGGPGGEEGPYPHHQPVRHSFLAPLADLLNFGPPCTRGAYDPEGRTFDIVATCPFRPGQEVTFYYTDDCSDVVIANYGFAHPMVPPCLTAEDWRRRAEVWREHAEGLEEALAAAYEATDRLEGEVENLRGRLRGCTGGGGGDGNGYGNGNGGGGTDRPDAVPAQQRRQRRTLRTSPPQHRDYIRGGGGDDGDDGRHRGGGGGGEAGGEAHGTVRSLWRSDRGL